jgi:hypothetical protein
VRSHHAAEAIRDVVLRVERHDAGELGRLLAGQ